MGLLARVTPPVTVLLTMLAAPAGAQLLSPGKLVRPHADLEGVRHCTKCHQLGERGVANARCLDCHTLLRTRIAAREGYHAGVADRTCGECHKDHFGPDFDAVHLDADAFDHAATGYGLTGAHATVECRACHTPAFITDPDVRRVVGGHNRLAATFLGLGTSCVGCHRTDDPHGDQFAARGCDDCHGETDWTRPDRFDHAASRYPLRGAHREVECRSCHTPVPGRRGSLQLTGLAFGTCAACHAADDPHRGAFAGRACEDCHAESDWRRPDRFDHAATRYPLTGRHRDVRCEECHAAAPGRTGPRSFRGLEYADCTACHADDDPHAGRLGTGCTECHTTDGWRARGGAAFEREFDHARTRFPLVGKHAAAACAACHRPDLARTRALALSFPTTRTRSYPVPAAERCGSCHVDHHAGAFRDASGGPECRSCHDEQDWSPTSFDIARHNRETRYALTGAHLAAPCVACHDNPALGQTEPVFRIPDQTCLACHRSLDPHGGQFGDQACDACHTTDTFRLPAFDHTRTRYPLDGAHRSVPCASCHPRAAGPDGRAVRVYRPLGTACRDCHAAGGA